METTRDRLVRYLDDAWSVEKSLVSMLDSAANDADDPNLRTLWQEHRDLTHQQEENLEARIRALGEEPSGGTGFFGSLMSRMGQWAHHPHDNYDKATQMLMKQFGIENFECAMYQSLWAYSTAIGDAETAQLAQQHLQQERQTADRIWGLIEPAAVRPARETPADQQQARAA